MSPHFYPWPSPFIHWSILQPAPWLGFRMPSGSDVLAEAKVLAREVGMPEAEIAFVTGNWPPRFWQRQLTAGDPNQ